MYSNTIIFMYHRYTHICQKPSKSDLFKLQRDLVTLTSFNRFVFFKPKLFVKALYCGSALQQFPRWPKTLCPFSYTFQCVFEYGYKTYVSPTLLAMGRWASLGNA